MFSITATDLPRFMACNGSRLMEGFNPLITDTTLRDEGNAADWLVKQVSSGMSTADELIDRKADNGVYITAEMVDNLAEYLANVGRGGWIEIDTSFRDHNGRWEIRGRSDHIRYDNRILYVSDLKYGWGIVEPENNWTLISYALGWMDKNRNCPVDTIVFSIYQPRPYHRDGKVRSWTISLAELGEPYRILISALSNPTDILTTSTLCGKCPAAVNCPAFRKSQMSAIDITELAFNDKLDNASLSFMLDTLERACGVLDKARDAYRELAMHKLRNGEIMDNYMIEQELANRSFKDFVTPDVLKAMTGLDLTKKTLLSPSQVEKAGVDKEFVASLCERRNKGAKLVRISADKKARKLFEK